MKTSALVLYISLLALQVAVSAAESQKRGAGQSVRVAAVQMECELGEIGPNLKKAERLVKEAFGKGANWVILPEFFTSAMAVHSKMLNAARPLNGEPLELLKRLAKEHHGVVGGSFLAIREGHTYNTFVLTFPDGATYFHDKDYPTFLENNYYIGGTDDGVFQTTQANIGAALCWEFVRAGTARRLKDKVDVVLGGACWWAPSDDVKTPAADEDRKKNLELIKETPVKFAKMLGVPVVFAQQAGSYRGFAETDEKEPYNSHFIGETMIVDGNGNVLARRAYEEGEGIILADVTLGKVPAGTDKVPDGFWIPDMSDLNGGTKEGRERTLIPGRLYYESVTRPRRSRRTGNQ